MRIDWLKHYERTVLRHPVAVITVSVVVLGIAGWFMPRFALDASADSLTLEHDEALSYYRHVRARYGSDEYLIVTFTPEGDLFSDGVLSTLGALRDDLAALDDVASVVSILDVPLIASPAVAMRDLPDGIRTLADPSTDAELAREELLNSPLYADYVISRRAVVRPLRLMT